MPSFNPHLKWKQSLHERTEHPELAPTLPQILHS